jgi:hypothetical protein
MARYYELGSSMGGCGVPSDRDRFYVSNPTSGRSQFLGASGSRQTGYWYSPKGNESKGGEWKQSGSGAWYRA